MLGDKTSILKNIKTSARVGYTPPVLKRALVQGLKEFRLTFRGDEDRGLVSSEMVWTSPVIYNVVPTALLVNVQCVRKDMYKAVEGPSTRTIVLLMINWSYLEPDEANFASHLTLTLLVQPTVWTSISNYTLTRRMLSNYIRYQYSADYA